MVMMSKTEMLELAEAYGIEGAADMKWQELVKAVNAAIRNEEPATPVEHPAEDYSSPALAEQPKKMEQTAKRRDLMDDYYGKSVMLAPEMPPERYRLIKYDEELGNEIEVEERHFDMDGDGNVFDKSGGEVKYNNQVGYHDYAAGTYRLKGTNNRKVVAMSSVPKENYGCGIRPGVDLVPIVSWNGRNGYLWTHPTYPSVKSLLMASGYYYDYKDQFKREPNIWYVAGKTLACDIGLVHAIFREIEQKEARKRQEDSAYRRGLGL